MLSPLLVDGNSRTAGPLVVAHAATEVGTSQRVIRLLEPIDVIRLTGRFRTRWLFSRAHQEVDHGSDEDHHADDEDASEEVAEFQSRELLDGFTSA